MTNAAVASVWKRTDPVLAAVLVKRFEAITKQMTNTLLRSGRSGVLNMARDFTCTILTRDNRLLLSGEGLPVHVIGIERLGRSMTELQPDFEPGDAFLNNSPFHGNSHPADFSIIVPVFHRGAHVFTTVTRAHQADCGNALPTTYMPLAADVYEEGALSFPCVRIQRDGRDVDDIVRMCRLRIRVPDQWYGDYLAQVGAARVGERALIELLDRHDSQTLDNFVEEWFRYGDQRAEEVIRRLPAGRWVGESHHDPVPGIRGIGPEGIPIRAAIEIDPVAGRIVVDLNDNIDVLPCGLNLSEATATSAAVSGILNSLHDKLPHNAGAFSRISVRIRAGSLAGGGAHPTSMSMATTNVADRLTGLVQSIMAEVSAGTGAAEGGLPMPPAWAVVSGRDPRRSGAPFVNQIFLAVTGGPATSGCDGWLGYGNAGTAGLLHRDSVELLEQRYPLRVEREEIIADSGGAGQWDGAPGSRAVFGPTLGPLTVAYSCDGHLHPPRGVRGGLDGVRADALVIRDGIESRLPLFSTELLEPPVRIVSISTGGGGYGDPLDRDPELVRRRVRDQWVTSERAHDVYGVVLRPGEDEVQVDEQATAALRLRLRP